MDTDTQCLRRCARGETASEEGGELCRPSHRDRTQGEKRFLRGAASCAVPLLLVWCCASTPYAGASNSSNATEFADAGNASNATEYADPSNSSNATLNVHASNASNVTTDASSYADPSNSSNATNCSAAGLPFPTALTVSQTSSVQSADNEIRIEFSFSATISKSTVISITGLRGANTSGPTLAIRPGVGGSLLVEENANWDPESGRVVLHSVRDIRANEGVVAVFTLRNAGSDNSPQTVSVLCANCSSHDSWLPHCSLSDPAHRILGVAYTPPACEDSSPHPPRQPYFGALCNATCFGTTVGRRCMCAKLQKGPGCNVSLTVAASASTALAKGAAGVVSLVIPGMPAFAAVSFPAGALAAAVTVEVQAMEFTTFAVASSDASKGHQVAGRVMSFGPPGTLFASDVTVLLPVTMPAAAGRILRPAWWNETAGQWEEVRLAAGGSVTIGGVAFLPALTNHFSQFTVLSAIAAQSTTTPPPPATTPQPAPSSAPSSVEAPSACGPIPGPCEAAILTGSLIGGLFALAILAILVHIALRLMRPSPPFPAPTPKRDPPRFAPVGLAPAPSATYGSAGAPAQGGGAVGHTFLYSEGDEVSRGAGAAHPVEQARREFSPSVQGEHHPPPSVRAELGTSPPQIWSRSSPPRVGVGVPILPTRPTSPPQNPVLLSSGPAPAYALYSGFA